MDDKPRGVVLLSGPIFFVQGKAAEYGGLHKIGATFFGYNGALLVVATAGGGGSFLGAFFAGAGGSVTRATDPLFLCGMKLRNSFLELTNGFCAFLFFLFLRHETAME